MKQNPPDVPAAGNGTLGLIYDPAQKSLKRSQTFTCP